MSKPRIITVSGMKPMETNAQCCICGETLLGTGQNWCARIVTWSLQDIALLIDLFGYGAYHFPNYVAKSEEIEVGVWWPRKVQLRGKPFIIVSGCRKDYGHLARLVVDIEDFVTGMNVNLAEQIAIARHDYAYLYN